MSFELKDNMTVMNLFEESQESVELKEKISSLNINISNLLIENYYDFIHISLARKEKEFSGWLIHDGEGLDDDDGIERITIGDTAFLNSEIGQTQLDLWHEDRFEGALGLLKYLFDIFKGSILEASFITGTTPSPKIAQFLVDVFHLTPVKGCANVTLFENGISSKQMVDQILDLATGLKRLDLRCPLPDDWSNPKVLKLDKLIAWPAEWFTTMDLMTRLDGKCVNINETHLKWQAFKAFMLKWQMTNDTRLKILEISFDGNWEGFQTDGLNLKKWDPQERDSHYPDLFGKPSADWFNCEFVHDIQREDGLLASFWRRENSFHFVVWHDRHPIATLQPNPEQLVSLENYEFADEDDEEDEDEE
ncbi:hypothetical protein L5515_000995 [Caenorhabditis briggsae]|uniref:F-box associated domain-containing protein n=1 Tax=Caenorhabditis briggsae TaxID=6238 RepID=A0AAE9DZZ5_CAEBR|nr:hypothetical protein L5515_000995 [Caenorhabditis briggsae]